MFGRKGVTPAPKKITTLEELNEDQGYVATLDHAKVAGEFFFELCYQQLAQNGDAVGIENFLGLLASAGGVTCIATSLIEWDFLRRQSVGGNLILEQEVDGTKYFCGDLPSRYLYESQISLLNIALPYAMKHGAAIEHDFLHEPISHAMQTVGTPQFGVPRIADEHRPGASPLELARIAWPQAENAFDTVQLAVDYRPAAMGFAIGKALDKAAPNMDPLTMANIVAECAVPMSMIDPIQFWDDVKKLKANAA